MIKEIKRQLYFSRNDLLFGAILVLGVALVGSVFSCVIVALTDDASGGIELGMIMFYTAACFYIFILAISNVGIRFNMAIKMGAVRWKYVFVNVLLSWVVCFVLLLAGNLWGYVDEFALSLVGSVPETALGIPVGAAAGVALGITLISTWMGAMLMRYGRVGFWIMWAVWMLLGMFGSQAATALNPERTDAFSRIVRAVVGTLSAFSIPVIMVALVALGVGLAIHTWLLLRKAPAFD